MQILDAMAVLRDSRIIHCDLKPENVLLKNVESGEVKVGPRKCACGVLKQLQVERALLKGMESGEAKWLAGAAWATRPERT